MVCEERRREQRREAWRRAGAAPDMMLLLSVRPDASKVSRCYFFGFLERRGKKVMMMLRRDASYAVVPLIDVSS